MNKRIIYSGNQPGWITATANMLMDRGADQAPLSIDDLIRRVPNQVGTARNDGHVTAAENGYDRNDHQAGYRLWITGIVDALTKARLVEPTDTGVRWIGDDSKTHQIRFFGKTYPVFGKPQRRESRDRYMLGDPAKDWTTPSLATDGRVLRGDTPPLQVNVSRGKHFATVKDPEPALEIHPLALAIPPMTPEEQQLVRADIEKHGIKVPIIMYPDKSDRTAKGKPKSKVLDGRHRAYFASVTGRPVELVEFEGTEDEARDHVASLNLHRRQLTRQQRALAAERLYGLKARKEAEKDMLTGRKKADDPGSNLSQGSNGHSEAKKAHERVREMAGGDASGFSKADAKAAAIIAQAPETAAKVDAGEITNTSKALREAKAELNGTTPDNTAGANVNDAMSLTERLGKAIYALKMAERELDLERIEDSDDMLARLEEITSRAMRLTRLIDGSQSATVN